MDYIEFFYKRLSELRMQKGVSARGMSLSIGQSESYINKIENRRTLPSLLGFFIYVNISASLRRSFLMKTAPRL